MSFLSLLYKDLREHAISLVSLGFGFFVVLMVAFSQQSTGTFNMSTFQVVRFSLVTVIPLIAFIVGNRLVVKEYVGGTRKFVEALPIQKFMPLLVKYLIGLLFILALCVVVVYLSAGVADAAEGITRQYTKLLLLKTCAIGLLIWSIVFFVSFTGRIRLVIYVVMGLTLMYFMRKPGFDDAGFPPLALLDRDLFVFERDVVPVGDLIGTVLISLAFVIAGFLLALVNDGSIAEQLGKPVTRRDMAAFALLGIGLLTVYQTLQKKWETETYALSGEYVARVASPGIAVSYNEPANQAVANRIVDSLSERLTSFQTAMGLADLPQVQIALNTELERTEIEPDLLDGVFLTANYTDYDTFEFALLNSIAMHHMLLDLTNGRWDYETRHWLLDGLARWWSEGSINAKNSPNNNELLGLALVSKQRFNFTGNPLLTWQTITDQHGFEGADALSYSAMLYLESIKGADTLIQLTADYINEEVGTTSLESLKRYLKTDTNRFERVTGLNFEGFTSDWLRWLDSFADNPDIAEFVASVPKLDGEIKSVRNENGGYLIIGQYKKQNGYVDGVAGTCVLRHQPAFAYDQETMIYTRKRDKANCIIDGIAHSVDSPYTSGDRFYGLLEFESEKFHRPIPLWVGRVHVQ